MKKLIYLLLCTLVWLVACGDTSTPNPSPLEPDIGRPEPLSVAQETTSFLIENTSSERLSYTISVDNDDGNPQDGDWFSVEPTEGTLRGGEQADITLTLAAGLENGRYTSTLTVDYGTGTTDFEVSGTVGEASAGSFTLETDGFTNKVSPGPGAAVRVPITINRQDGFSGAVALEILGAPDGLSGTFAPNPTSGDESILTIQVEESVAAGIYTLSVRGTSGGESATTEVTVEVTGTTSSPTFSLALSPANVSVEPGETATAQVTVRKTDSFSGNVSLSAEDVPDGVTVSFDPRSAATSSQVRLEVSDEVDAGSYTLTITGSGGGQTSSTRLGLTVTGGDQASGTASITGTARTDAFLGNFTVPSNVTGTTANLTTSSVRAARPDYVPGQLLVQYEPGLNAQSEGASLQQAFTSLSQQVAAEYGLSILEPGSFQTPSLVEVPEGAGVLETAERLAQNPNVVYAEPNYYIYPLSVPNDAQFDQQWNFAVSGVPVAWDAEDAASNITVAVIDSGFQTSHPDLSGRFVAGYDFCNTTDTRRVDGQEQTFCASEDDGVSPDGANDTHGTHVAGIIGATGNNERGVAGVLKGGAKLVPVKVFFNYNFTDAAALARAIRWAAGDDVSGVPRNNNPADIINLSLGTTANSQTIQNAVNEAQSRGALLIAAAGNDGNDVLYPAKYPGVVAVGSVNSNFQTLLFFQRGLSAGRGRGGRRRIPR